MQNGNQTTIYPKSKALDRLKQAWEENPLLVIGVIGGAMGAAAKLIEAIGGYQSKRAYAQRYGR